MDHDTALILQPKHRERLARSPRERRTFFEKIETHRIPLILLAQTGRLPGYFRTSLLSKRIPVACSSLDPFHLESRLLGLIRERLDRKTTRHGVLVEREGHGVLITGDSGIGKTTCALALVGLGYRFVADDRIVLEVTEDGKLRGFGHERTRRCVYLRERGIFDAGALLGTAMTRERAVLNVDVELIGIPGGREGGGGTRDGYTTIMGVRLPRVAVRVHHDPRETARRVDRAAGAAPAAELAP